ncbi:MAG: hypothetical protein RML14_06825 [Meiothermus sp.]|uniref:hypothetical protein n=1 Tax=Meiothermus sp. TaxID=1955249 RepID=UPI00298EF72C|nr:hypothetical protein [Meiothermus sp.]MDW8481580.1 hypothetical protein [Meiothermus sp.]
MRSLALFDRLVQQGQLAPVNSLLPSMPKRAADRYSDAKRNLLVSRNGQIYGFWNP